LKLVALKIKNPASRQGQDFQGELLNRSVTSNLPNGFWHISSDCQRAGLPVQQSGLQANRNYRHVRAKCQAGICGPERHPGELQLDRRYSARRRMWAPPGGVSSQPTGYGCRAPSARPLYKRHGPWRGA